MDKAEKALSAPKKQTAGTSRPKTGRRAQNRGAGTGANSPLRAASRFLATLTCGGAVGTYIVLLLTACIIAPPLFGWITWYAVTISMPAPLFWAFAAYWATATIACYMLDAVFLEYGITSNLQMKQITAYLWDKAKRVRSTRLADNDAPQ